ncbi:MAG: hypothetical protein OXE58_12675 [Acidobacteria bacterium]|nr:hypothetical protein [Acidobacteriota bacterium]
MRFHRLLLPSAVGFAALLSALLVASLGGAGCVNQEDNAAAARMKLDELVGYWAVRGRDSEGNNYIRPAVRFRVQNTNPEPIEYVQVMSVFRRESSPEEAWGTGYVHSVAEEVLAPGEVSEEHTLRADSNYISQGSPESMFENELWEDVEIEMFVRVGASSWVSQGKTVALRRLGPPGVEKYLEPIDDEPIYGIAPGPDDVPETESEAEPEAPPERR